jgi:hypothetical protein
LDAPLNGAVEHNGPATVVHLHGELSGFLPAASDGKDNLEDDFVKRVLVIIEQHYSVGITRISAPYGRAFECLVVRFGADAGVHSSGNAGRFQDVHEGKIRQMGARRNCGGH